MGDDAPETLTESLMYKLSYYRFADVQQNLRDRNRGAVSSKVRSIRLHSFSEVFSSEHWLVRIYKVNDPHPRGFEHRMIPS